jgi:hypothetical protein
MAETDDLPGLLLQYVPHKIVFVQTLHNNDDAAGPLVVRAAVERVIKPVVDVHSLDL